MATFFTQLALTVVGGAIGSLITLWLGSRQFRSQRWWDRKAEAYIAIIDAFHDLLDEDAVYWDAEYKGEQVPAAKQIELREIGRRGEAKIERQQRLASFLICKAAEDALAKLFRELEAANSATDWVEYRENYTRALQNGFDSIKKIAVSDLRV